MNLHHPKSCRFYCISLSEQSERHQHISSLGRQWDVAIEFVPAIAGPALSEQDVKASGYFWHPGLTRGPLNVNEVACLLSHRQALASFLQSDAEYAVILEDDAEFDQRLLDVLPRLAEIPLWDVVKLEHRFEQMNGYSVVHCQDTQIIVPSRPGLGSTGILYRRLGAQKVLQMSQKFSAAFDTQFNFAWRYRLNLLQLYPSLVWESQSFKTSIGNRPSKPIRRNLFNKISQRFGRWQMSLMRKKHARQTARTIRRACARLGLR